VAHRPIITLTTDFGLHDHFVGTLKGVILDILPEAEIVDICHSVEAFDILDGALTLAQAYKYFPYRTVHLVVVDPGVGGTRRPVVASTDRHNFVAPDNGVLSTVYGDEPKIQVRHVTAQHYFLQPVSHTFHARDIFAPVAGYLAKGADPAKFGPAISDYVRFSLPKPTPTGENTWRGVVLKVDRFGNLITNISPAEAPILFQGNPPPFKIVIGDSEITQLREAYSDGAAGEVFAIEGSMGYLEIATNQASAAKLLSAGKGSEFIFSLLTGTPESSVLSSGFVDWHARSKTSSS
jgi:S-adenosyl-L-methionine hydrolase (adenosine-forming)